MLKQFILVLFSFIWINSFYLFSIFNIIWLLSQSTFTFILSFKYFITSILGNSFISLYKSSILNHIDLFSSNSRGSPEYSSTINISNSNILSGYSMVLCPIQCCFVIVIPVSSLNSLIDVSSEVSPSSIFPPGIS